MHCCFLFAIENRLNYVSGNGSCETVTAYFSLSTGILDTDRDCHARCISGRNRDEPCDSWTTFARLGGTGFATYLDAGNPRIRARAILDNADHHPHLGPSILWGQCRGELGWGRSLKNL
jgi:hypothetical protein